MVWFGSRSSNQFRAKRPWWWRLGRWVLVAFLFATVGVLINHYYKMHIAQTDLNEMIAQLDQDDPDWRLEAIEAKRKVIPDEANGALVVLEIAKALPNGWNKEDLLKELEDYPPNRRLRTKLAQRLTEKMQPLAVQLSRFRDLTKLPQGRYAITYTEDFISTLVPHLVSLRQVIELGHRDMVQQIEKSEWANVQESCLATLNAARSVGDEPLMISPLVRMAGQSLAMMELQRLLAQAQLSGAELAALQSEWEKEAKVPLFKWAFRGERGGLALICSAYSEGKAYLGNFKGDNNYRPSLDERIGHFLSRPKFTESQAWILNKMTDALQAVDSPIPDQHAAMLLLESEARDSKAPILGKLFCQAHIKVWEAFSRNQAKMHCTNTALAVERYRLKHKHWPNKLDEVVPEFLATLPLDQFDNQSLSLKATKDGVVVFSLGLKRDKVGEYWDQPVGRRNVLDSYYEFRLWNPDSRRLPPLLPLEEDDEDGMP